MPDRQPNPRSLNFAGDVNDHGQPLPMTSFGQARLTLATDASRSALVEGY